LKRRDLLLGAGSLATAAVGSAHAQSQPIDPARYLSPEFRPHVALLRSYTALSPLTSENLEKRRKAQGRVAPLAAPAFVERRIPGPTGAPDVRVYVVNGGDRAKLRPAILHMHGGGFVTGDALSAVAGQQALAAAVDCIIVTVDYRLAPETRFPGSLEDNYAALKWLYANAQELGVDRNRIAVAGESAGGGHAAMLAIAARDRGEVPVMFQGLIYPMLDDRTGSTRKTPPYEGMFIWTAGDNNFGWTALLGVPSGSAHVPPGSVPARLESVKGLPPAFIGVGSIDLFVDEDIEYARRLVAAGVSTELHVIPGAFHGFDAAPSKLATDFKATYVAALKRAFFPLA
jgi:acetyl esterase/lipase